MSDLAAELEAIATQPKPEPPDPVTIAIPAQIPKLAQATTIWCAWMEDYDCWDGVGRYTDLDTARLHAAVDYVNEEYADFDRDHPHAARVGALTWVFAHSMWHLNDSGRDTMVRLSLERVFAPAEASR